MEDIEQINDLLRILYINKILIQVYQFKKSWVQETEERTDRTTAQETREQPVQLRCATGNHDREVLNIKWSI